MRDRDRMGVIDSTGKAIRLAVADDSRRRGLPEVGRVEQTNLAAVRWDVRPLGHMRQAIRV
jgi:hypothetical protein